jgi:hypothetical protein
MAGLITHAVQTGKEDNDRQKYCAYVVPPLWTVIASVVGYIGCFSVVQGTQGARLAVFGGRSIPPSNVPMKSQSSNR